MRGEGAYVAKGVRMVKGSMCGKVGHVWRIGGGVVKGVCGEGGHGRGGACMAGKTVTAADGTHPTVMYSCSRDVLEDRSSFLPH